MDWLPLIPTNENNNEIAPHVREIFQNRLTKRFPVNLCETFINNNGTYENDLIKGVSSTIKQINEEYDEFLHELESAEEQILKTHGKVLMKTNNDLPIIHLLKLKRTQFFEKLPKEIVTKFGFIQKSELFPHRIEQHLDFTFNPTLHTCKKPCKLSNTYKAKEYKDERVQENVSYVQTRELENIEEEDTFILEPNQITFNNCDLNRTYKKKIKLRNISKNPQNIQFSSFPKTVPLVVTMVSEPRRLAPGMYSEFLITYSPTFHKNYSEKIMFNSWKGKRAVLSVTCKRDPPKLTCYVFNSTWMNTSIRKPTPGSQHFSERRCEALNFTIDCGTCLLGASSLVTLMMTNEGQKGRFFFATEQDWFFQSYNVDALDTRAVQLSSNGFSIFPTYFEIDSAEDFQIFILFEPDKAEFYNEKFILICDNNTYQEIEVVGDCVTFEDTFIKIDLFVIPEDFHYANNRLTATGLTRDTYNLTVTITNNSPLYFDYYWGIQKKTEDDTKLLNPKWIHISNVTSCLPSYSATDFNISISPETEEGGVYSSFLSICLKNIPIKSLSKQNLLSSLNSVDKESICSCLDLEENVKDKLDETVAEQYTDIHLCKLEIEFILKFEKKEIPPEENQDLLPEIATELKRPKLKFSNNFISFGNVYKGSKLCKSIFIKNLTEELIHWNVVEVRLNENLQIYVQKFTNLSKVKGDLRGKKKKLHYQVKANDAVRWMSALVLFSHSDSSEDFRIESVCIVTYHVLEVNIDMHSSETSLPILSPKVLLYVNIPTIHKIHVHNFGQLTGCFYFLEPTGRDADKLQLKFHPQSGVVPANCCAEIKVYINPLSAGIFDDLFVPCFTGDLQNVISLKVICAVSDINVFFYLPNAQVGYKRILWPSKTASVADWNNYFMDVGEYSGRGPQFDFSEGADNERTKLESEDSLTNLIGCNSVAYTYPTVKMKVQMKQPRKVTFYMENISPIQGHFEVEATNFGGDYDCVNEILVKAKAKNPRESWEKSCQRGYGIVVEPEVSCGSMIRYEIVEINIWVYANTWGRYLEEIIVEINDLIPFCFNLLIEVVGSPIEFPFAVNTILELPTLRLGNIAYSSAAVMRTIKVNNLSTIPVNISWHVFKYVKTKGKEPPFNFIGYLYTNASSHQEFITLLTSKYYGYEMSDCLAVEPKECWMKQLGSISLKIIFDTFRFKPQTSRTSFKYNIVGFLHIRTEDSFKENYFKRDSGLNLEPAQLVVLGNLELPMLELSTSDETTLDVFVNDLIFKKVENPEIHLRVRNSDKASILFSANIEKPFKIKQVSASKPPSKVQQSINLKPEDCVELTIASEMTYDDLLQFADLIYKDVSGLPQQVARNFTSIITKNLILQQEGTPNQMIPIELRLHYPHIEVKPTFLKCGPCLLYNTKKCILTIYNLTGSTVRFEIYKTSGDSDFEVVPNYADIPASTGANKQFIDLMVYFSPREVKSYVETMRILTNIPQYYIDIPMNGYGSSNEKFQIN